MFAVLSRRRRPPESKLAAADAKATQAVDALRRYRDNDHIALRIGDEAYLAGLAIRQRKLSVANLAVHDLRGQARASEFPPVPDLRRTARELGVEELRELVAQVIDVVFVSAGSGSTAQRATVCPAGTAPRVLPHAGDKGRAMNAIAPRRRWINADTAAAHAIEDRLQKNTHGLSRAELAARINAERCQGLSLRDIARNLDRDGVQAPRGGAWLPSTVSRMLPATASIANAASSAHPSH